MQLGPSRMALIERVDWSATPLGPIEAWPATLTTLVKTVLYSPTPMLLMWGRELVQIYNDAFTPSLGRDKHPAAMGQRARDCWPEIWSIIAPQLERVLSHGEPTQQQNALIPIYRNDRIEEVFWTYSYSPVFDESGLVSGVLVVCTETTTSVVEVRRRMLLQAIAERRGARASLRSATETAFACIATNPDDVPFAAAFDANGELIAQSGPAVPALRAIAASAEAMPALVELSEPVVSPTEPVKHVFVAPLRERATFVFGISPRIAFDASYRAFFFELIASIDAAIDRAIAIAASAAADTQRANLYRHFMQAPFPIAVFKGPLHIVELANSSVLEAWGKDEAVISKPIAEALPELEGQPFLGWLDGVYTTGVPFEGREQLAMIVVDGALAEVYANFVYAPLRDVNGEIEGVLLSAFIVTDQVRARQQLEAALARAEYSERQRELALQEAERVNEAKDEFLATMSHELRTPLNAMLGWATLLRTTSPDAAKVMRGLEVIERNAEAQARLISDLLDVSRIISGKLRLVVKKTEVAAAIEAAIDVVRPAADAKKVRLVVDLDQDAGSLVADPDRLQQIVWNLLINAIKFTRTSGSVVVSARRVDSWMSISVQDTGVGIAAENLIAIFQRFKQVDGSTTRSHGGLGLGLAIVRHLVEGHGGTVSAESAGIDRGSTFTVRLPIHAVDTSDVAALSDPREVLLVPPTATTLDDVRILIVDDEPDSRELLRVVLESAGATVSDAASADQAIAKVMASDFDLLVSDIGMPGRDGYSLVRELRTRVNIPAIALTAYARAEDARLARAAGFQEHVTKPVDANKLIETIRGILR